MHGQQSPVKSQDDDVIAKGSKRSTNSPARRAGKSNWLGVEANQCGFEIDIVSVAESVSKTLSYFSRESIRCFIYHMEWATFRISIVGFQKQPSNE